MNHEPEDLEEGEKVELICARAYEPMAPPEFYETLTDVDFSHTCEGCGVQLGISSTGTEVIKKYTREKVRLICPGCMDEDNLRDHPLIPDGAVEAVAKGNNISIEEAQEFLNELTKFTIKELKEMHPDFFSKRGTGLN